MLRIRVCNSVMTPFDKFFEDLRINNPSAIQNLKDSGYSSLQGLEDGIPSKDDLMNESGFNLAEANKILQKLDSTTREINNSDNHTTQRYYQSKAIGFGRESIVFSAINDCNESVCIKIEPIGNDSQIMNELSVLQILKGCRGVPIVLFTGTTTYLHKQWRAIVTDVVGDHTLADLRNKLSLSEIDSYSNIAIDILQNIHKRGIIHNDIKPEHFIFCKNTMYLIDYGSAGSLHSKPLYVTQKYASPDFYFGIRPSEKNDFESLWFTVLSLCESLPWDDNSLSDVDIFYLKTQMLPEKFSSADNDYDNELIKRERQKFNNLQQLAKTFVTFTTETQSE